MSARRQRTASTAATTTAAANTPLIARPLRPGHRTCYRLCVAALVVCLFLVVTSTFRRKPKAPSGPAPVDGQHVLRLVAVGDLHGDYDNALKVLHMADVVDANGSWTGNVDYFVQTGDIIDRGVDTIKLFAWMEQLRAQATNAGGIVFSHLGNHEFMNVLGDWRYVYQPEIATFGSVAARQTALATGSIGTAWAHNYSTASRVPLHPAAGPPFTDYTPSSAAAPAPLAHAAFAFMHGGLSPVFARTHGTPFPSAVNRLGAALLRRCQRRVPQPPPHPPAPYAGLPPGATDAEAEFYGADGPVWYRGWALDAEAEVCARVWEVLETIGVRRLVMGHTPDFEKIVSRCGGKIIIIDTGISKVYGGALSALSVTYTLTPVHSSFNTKETSDPSGAESNTTAAAISKGKGPGKWIEREQILALYPDTKTLLVSEEREVEGDFW